MKVSSIVVQRLGILAAIMLIAYLKGGVHNAVVWGLGTICVWLFLGILLERFYSPYLQRKIKEMETANAHTESETRHLNAEADRLYAEAAEIRARLPHERRGEK